MAALTRRFGASQLELIEDAVQGAILRALERWPAGDEARTYLSRALEHQSSGIQRRLLQRKLAALGR